MTPVRRRQGRAIRKRRRDTARLTTALQQLTRELNHLGLAAERTAHHIIEAFGARP